MRSYSATDPTPNQNGDILKAETPKLMSKGRVLKNLITVNLGFLLLYTAFMGLTFLQSTLNSEHNVGVISQAVVYGTAVSTVLLVPRFFSIKFGLKMTILFAHIISLPYIAGNLYPKVWILVPSAVLFGIGSGIQWACLSAYINGLSYLYAAKDREKAKQITVKFFGFFYFVFNASQIFGNLISFSILKSGADNSIHRNFSLIDIDMRMQETSGTVPKTFCGAAFCGGIAKTINLPPQETRNLLIGIYLAISVLSAVVIFFFVDSFKIDEKAASDDSTCSKLLSSLKQMKEVNQMLLIVISVYATFQASFMFSDFTEAFVGCTWGLEYVGMIGVVFAASSGGSCVVQSCLCSCFHRSLLIAIALINNLVLSVVLLKWDANSGHPYFIILIAGLWGVSDGIWNTQLAALYGVIFRDEEEAAFANLRLCESFGLMMPFLCNSLMCTSTKIYMQIAVGCKGYIGYLIVELRSCMRIKTFTLQKSN